CAGRTRQTLSDAALAVVASRVSRDCCGVGSFESGDQVVPGEVCARVGEGVLAAPTTLGRSIDRVYECVGERIDVVRGHEPAGEARGVEVDHRWETTARGGDHWESHRHR